MVRLTEHEQQMADGKFGRSKQLAMELLIDYADALGAERFVEVASVAGGIGASSFMQGLAEDRGGIEGVFKEFLLNSAEPGDIEAIDTFAFSLINTMDKTCWKQQNVSCEDYLWGLENEACHRKLGFQCYFTCTPHLLGTVPLFGQHLAWMESSAISFANSIAGARTNTEGTESAGASAYTGRTPYWGLHLPENRKARLQLDVNVSLNNSYDWGTLGYYTGLVFKEQVGVLNGVKNCYDMAEIKQCTAAAAASGGVELFHIAGRTPEAPDLATALDRKKPDEVFAYSPSDRRTVRERLCSTDSDDIDFVLLGCPHCNVEEIFEVVRLLKGRRLSENTEMWIFTPEPLRHLAQRQGYLETLEKAGVKVMSDSCPAVAMTAPEGTRTAATNSAKQAHYYPGLTGIGTYYYSTEQCIEVAVTGKAQYLLT